MKRILLYKILGTSPPVEKIQMVQTADAAQKKGPVLLFRVFFGDEILPSYMRNIVNHYKDPY